MLRNFRTPSPSDAIDATPLSPAEKREKCPEKAPAPLTGGVQDVRSIPQRPYLRTGKPYGQAEGTARKGEYGTLYENPENNW